MRVNVLADSNWESKIEHSLRPLALHKFFETRDYGCGLQNLTVVANCRDPALGRRQRVRFERATATLRMDVMLFLPEFVAASHSRRRELLAQVLLREVRSILESRKLAEFDTANFLSDFGNAVAADLLGSDAARFDHRVLDRALTVP